MARPTCDRLDIVRVDANAVNEQWRVGKDAKVGQELNGRNGARRYGDASSSESFSKRSGRSDDERLLKLAFGDVYRHWQRELARQRRGRAEEIVGDGVWRVG